MSNDYKTIRKNTNTNTPSRYLFKEKNVLN